MTTHVTSMGFVVNTADENGVELVCPDTYVTTDLSVDDLLYLLRLAHQTARSKLQPEVN